MRLTDLIMVKLKGLAINAPSKFERATAALGLTGQQKTKIEKTARQAFVHDWVLQKLSDEEFILPLCSNFEQWTDEVTIKISPKERSITIRIK